MMGMRVVIADFEYNIDRHGRPYGWGVARYTVPERLYGSLDAGCTPEEVRRRIAAQLDDDTLCARADCTIVNIRESELAPAVEELDRRFRHEAHMPRA